MADRLRSWGRWLAVTVLAVGAVAAALLKPFGWDWPWLLAAVAGVVAILTPWGKILASRIEGTAKRDDERKIALQTGALGQGVGKVVFHQFSSSLTGRSGLRE